MTASTQLSLITSLKSFVVTFGKFNPPTIGHRKLAEQMAKAASSTGERAKMFLSQKSSEMNAR